MKLQEKGEGFNKMKYVCLLRGINVGGKNKVSMGELKTKFADIGYRDVLSYVNSGNIIFCADDDSKTVKIKVNQILKAFPFDIKNVILTQEEYLEDSLYLPAWWNEPLARKDVLFYTDEVDYEEMKTCINKMPLNDEVVYFGKKAVFWGKHTEKEYLKTSYHKLLMKESFYPFITIRNNKTFNKLEEMLR